MKPSQSTPLQTSPIDRTVRTVGRILVGLLFVWAGIDKVQGLSLIHI